MRQEHRQTRWGRESYVLMDVSEAAALFDAHRVRLSHPASWYGDTHDSFRRKVDTGDNTMVDASEKILASIENIIPVSRSWRVVEDVVGAVPNIPAFLAGHAQHMRRRQRVSRENAPLSVYLDLTSSAILDTDTVMRRGVVMLALVRMLVEHRAVELWAGISQDVGISDAGTVAWRIDTAPLDLARAAYHVASSAMPRLFGYGINRRINNAGGGWAFRSPSTQASSGEERFRMLFGNETLFVPPIVYGDPMVRDPIEWLHRVMSKYINTEEEQ